MNDLAADMQLQTSVPVTKSTAPDTAPNRVPRITAHAFGDSQAVLAAIEDAARDRRMQRAHLTVATGGVKTALAQYRTSPTPNLILLESQADGGRLLAELDSLAEVCDAGTRLIVIGESNDIDLYRELMRRGVSEYLRTPIEPPAVVSAIATAYADAGPQNLGRLYAFIGACGGVGSSTIAHNVAATLSRTSGTGVVLADMDMAFGTASLNFGLEPTANIGEAIRDVAKFDDQMLDRLLTRCNDHLSLLAAPSGPDEPIDIDAGAFEKILDVVQASASHVVLDLPSVWASWTRDALVAADEVVITATPDLASLTNARHLIDSLRLARPNDGAPRLVLNQVGVPGRPEIKPRDFAKALEVQPAITLPFDAAAFGEAANAGRVLADASRRSAQAKAFGALAQILHAGAPATARAGVLGRLFGRGKIAPRKA